MNALKYWVAILGGSPLSTRLFTPDFQPPIFSPRPSANAKQ